jgi:hypothetical protein
VILRVAHHPLDREVPGVAGAAEQLHCVGGDLHRDIGGEALRADEMKPSAGAAFGARRRGLDHQPGCLYLRRHVRQHEMHAYATDRSC